MYTTPKRPGDHPGRFGVQLFKSDGDKSFQRNDHFDSVFRITVNINISLANQTAVGQRKYVEAFVF